MGQRLRLTKDKNEECLKKDRKSHRPISKGKTDLKVQLPMEMTKWKQNNTRMPNSGQ